LQWWEEGERFFADVVGHLSDVEFDDPSLLPEWSRRKLIAHVARNADALVNLVTWANTGHETPMYVSPEAREGGIAATARQSAPLLRADLQEAQLRLAGAIGQLPEHRWKNAVRTAQGRDIPVSEVPWMRCREVWVHAVDLNSGVGFVAIPEDVLVALIDDVADIWRLRDQTPPITFVTSKGRRGSGEIRVTGELPDIVGWITGRHGPDNLSTDGTFIELPPWL
jgi:maleylpyruvate isomerase